jgi:ribonuclease BN (tRNA processing enzyme)
MKLTVLGKSPAWQDTGGACSGYLVQSGETTVLLDCGNGVFGKLRERVDYAGVDAIFISHLHADHFFDLIPYAFALTFSTSNGEVEQFVTPLPDGQGTRALAGHSRPLLWGPPGAREKLRGLCELWGMPSLLEDAFEFAEYDPAEEIVVGSLTFSFRSVPHFIDTWAIEARDDRGRRITYGADCRPNDALVEFATGADLLIAESTIPEPEPNGDRGHLTPAEAGDHASRAGVGQLLLTHISDELDREWATEEASRRFDGPVEVAFEGFEYEV